MTAEKVTFEDTAPAAHGNEEHLLGCILAGADPANLDVSPADFYQPRNEYVFKACLAVAEDGTRPDPQSVMLKMGKWAHRLPTGATWLVDIARDALPMHAAAFATQVKRDAARRALKEIAQRILFRADEDDPDALLEQARQWLDRPATGLPSSRPIAELLPEFIDRVEAGGDKGPAVPWTDLDRHLNGLQPGRVYTIGARPGVGKSVMLLNLATHWAGSHRQGVFFASLEMPAHELVGRVVASNAHISQTALARGELSELDWARLAKKRDDLEAMPLWICDDGSQSLRAIRAGALEMKRRGRLGLVCVDYIQLIEAPDKRLSRQQQLGEVTRGLKRLAKELGVPVATASQLRRSANGTNHRPGMDELRESGDIEADSDAVMLLHVPEPDSPWDMELVVAKNRSGSTGVVELMFDGARATLQNHDPRFQQ